MNVCLRMQFQDGNHIDLIYFIAINYDPLPLFSCEQECVHLLLEALSRSGQLDSLRSVWLSDSGIRPD